MNTTLNYFDKTLTTALRWLITILFTVATLLYTLQIFLRFFFSEAIYWIDPTISYLFTISALAGATLGSKDNENIKIDLLRKYNHIKQVRFINLVFSLLTTLAILAVFFGHFKTELNHVDQTSGIPNYLLDIPYLFIFLVSSFYFFKNILNLFNKHPHKHPHKHS